MPSVVVFYHPGAEHSVTRKMLSIGVMPWSTLNYHRRKFLEAYGEYVTIGQKSPAGGKLHFWGEWEPDSYVSKLSNVTPRFLHIPFLKNPSPTIVPSPGATCNNSISCGGNVIPKTTNSYQNTDPFVFAENFFYSVCQQITHNNNPSNMTKLCKGRIILFGSRVNDQFALDTVFVVGDSKPFTPNNIFKDLSGFAPNDYPLIMQLSGSQNLVCYKGASYSNPCDGMYSFVPCKTYDKGCFERPILSISDFASCNMAHIMSSGNQNQGRKCTTVKPNEAKMIWDCLRQSIQKQGFLEGFNFKY
ncbi:MAG: hypothetical protein KBT12_03495 [Bacteroidales bacterium]|nr:hypothetical protein [Candidatus Physcousia equi]